MTGAERAAAEAFLGRPIPNDPPVRLPGRLERRGRELWDGAHNPAATSWLRSRLTEDYEIVVASILEDKDVEAMLADLAQIAPRLIATQSTNRRAVPAAELASRAAPYFADIVAEPHPQRALARARQSTRGGILVTGSLYLLADLS